MVLDGTLSRQVECSGLERGAPIGILKDRRECSGLTELGARGHRLEGSRDPSPATSAGSGFQKNVETDDNAASNRGARARRGERSSGLANGADDPVRRRA